MPNRPAPVAAQGLTAGTGRPIRSERSRLRGAAATSLGVPATRTDRLSGVLPPETRRVGSCWAFMDSGCLLLRESER